MSKPYAVPYCRFSSKKQVIGSSEARQESGFATFLATSGLAPAPTAYQYWDKGQSAYHGHHRTAEFGKLLADATARRWPADSVVWFEDQDRFGRGELDVVLGDWKAITRNGYRIHVASLGMTYDRHTSEMEMMGVIMKAIIAHEESEKKAKRNKAAWVEKRKTGRNVKYRAGQVSKSCPKWISPTADGMNYQLNDFAPTLRAACLDSIAGLGQSEISRKHGTPAGGLTSIFRQRTLIGEYQPRNAAGQTDGQPVPNHYPALLTLDEYRRLQASLDSRLNHKGKRGEMVSNLFTGLIYNHAGEALAIKRQSNGKAVLKPYQTGKGYIGGKQVNYDLVESSILAAFLKLTDADVYPADMTGDRKRLAAIQAETADRKEQVADLESQVADGTLRAAAATRFAMVHDDAITALDTEREALETKLASAKADSLTEAKTLITETMDGLTGQALLDCRTRTKAVVARLVKRLDLTIYDPRSFILTLTLANGNSVRVVQGAVCEDWPTVQETQLALLAADRLVMKKVG